jgi:hypothetical protein
MQKVLALLGALLLSVSWTASVEAGWGNGSPKKDHPQAQEGQGDSLSPGGHGGGGFGTSENGDNPSGVNGNQGKDPNEKNDDRGNAGAGGGEP